MVVIRGVNVYPSQVEHTLLQVGGVSPHFQLVVDRDGTLDRLHVRVEADEEHPAPDGLVAEIVERMKHSLGVSVSAAIEPAGSLPRSEGGKLRRLVDNRSL